MEWDIDCTRSSLSLGDNHKDVCNIGYCIRPNLICNGHGGGEAVTHYSSIVPTIPDRWGSHGYSHMHKCNGLDTTLRRTKRCSTLGWYGSKLV